MSVSTLQYHACPTCGPKVLFDYGKCRTCQQPFAAPVTHPDLRPDLRRYNNQTSEHMAALHRKRSKAAIKKARQGKATAKSWARRYEVSI